MNFEGFINYLNYLIKQTNLQILMHFRIQCKICNLLKLKKYWPFQKDYSTAFT